MKKTKKLSVVVVFTAIYAVAVTLPYYASPLGGGISSTTALPEDLGLATVSVYKSSDNFIVVAGAQGKTITVFNSLGHVVSTTRGLAGDQKVYTGAKGMYIVKVGNRSFKTSL